VHHDRDELDRAIDDALVALTGGAPRDGLRLRVAARIAEPEPAPTSIWRLVRRGPGRSRWWAVIGIAAATLILAIVLTVDRRTPAPRVAGASAPAAVPGRMSGPAVPRATGLPSKPTRSVQRAASRSAADRAPGPGAAALPGPRRWPEAAEHAATAEAIEGLPEIAPVTITSLPLPQPIVNTDIAIAPVVIRALDPEPAVQLPPAVGPGGPRLFPNR
jgi:hypothetical protein